MIADIQMMNDQIAGLTAKGKKLREKEAVFLKTQGLNEEIEKTQQERSDIRKELASSKKKRDDFIAKKNEAMAEISSRIAEKMGEVLPVGTAVFDYNDDDDQKAKQGLNIGWSIEGKYTPYNGLSGAQKQTFDAALSHMLNANIIVLEAAELDQSHLAAALEDLSTVDAQVIVNTCHPVDVVPSVFVRVDLAEVAA